MIIWSFFLIIVILFLEFIYVFCFFNFTFRIMDGLSRNPSQSALLIFLIKIILITFSVLLNLNTYYIILVIVHTIYGYFLFRETLTHYPYHDKFVSKCYGMFVAAYFWINGSLFFVHVVNVDFFYVNMLVIIFMGVVLFVKLFLTLRNYTVKRLMMSDLDEINSDIHLDLKVRLFNQLAQTIQIKKNELLLASLLKIHYDKCEDVDCICRRRTDLYDPFLNIYGDQNLQFHKDDVFVKHYLIKMMKEGIAKFSDSKLLYLDFIFYNFEALKIYAPIYCFIQYFQQKYNNNLNLGYEFCIHRLLAQLERFLIKKNLNAGLNERLLIDNVKKFDKGITSLRIKLSQCIDDYMQIWNTLNQNMPDLGVLLKTCNHCIQNNNILLQQYEELVDLNDQSQKLKNYMEVYCLHISFDELLWNQVEKEIQMPIPMEISDSLHQDLDYLLHKYNMFDENVGTVVISPNFENMGQILWVSANIPKLFHYEFNQFKTMNVSNLMPETIGKCHDKILQTFYLTSKEVAVNHIRHLWAVNKEGFCFSANILVKVVPTAEDFEIMGLIHKLNDGDYLLTNSEGELINIGQKMSEVMELSPQNLTQTKINLQLLAPRLTQYYKRVFIEDNDLPDTTNIIFNSAIVRETVTNKQRKSTGSEVKRNKEKEKNDEKNYIEDIHKQIRFYVFIPQDIENLMKLQQEEVRKSQAKFDLQKTKERVFKDVKMLIQMRKCFGSSLKKIFSKIDLKTVKKVLRVKASLQHVKFSNGDINFVAIKILYIEIKKPDLISFEKRQKQSKYIKLFLKDMKKIEDNVMIINSNQKAVEDQENREDNNETELLVSKTPSKEQTSNDRIKNMLSLFRKKSPNAALLSTPKKEKDIPKLEKEGSMTRQLSNINTSSNLNPQKKFLEDSPPSGQEDSSKKNPPMKKNALKNMLMRIKKNPNNLKEEEKKSNNSSSVEPSPNKPFSMMFKRPSKINTKGGETEEKDLKKERSLNKKISLPDEKPESKKLPSLTSIGNVGNGLIVERDPKKKLSSINTLNGSEHHLQKQSSIINIAGIKKPPPFGSQSSGNFDKNPLNILSKIEENVKNSKEKEPVSDLDSSSPEKPHNKAWTNKFRDILLKKGIFSKKDQHRAALKAGTIKKPMISFGGGGGSGGGGGGFLKGLLNRNKNQKNNADDSGTSRSVKSELLGEEGSSNSDEKSVEMNILLKSENSTNKKEVQKQDLREKMQKIWGLEEQEQVNSIASSAFSSVAQNSLKKIKENLKKQRTSLRLRISNLLAFFSCIIISALSLSQYLSTNDQISNLFNILQEVNTIAFYNENFLKIYNYYEVRRMISFGYYDWELDWDVQEKKDIGEVLDIMTQISNEDIVQDIASSNNYGKQNDYVFLTYMIILKIDSTPQTLKMNFRDFYMMFIVAINETLYLNTSSDFVMSSINGNDYLSFIFDNFDILEQIIDSNNLFIHDILVSANDNLKMRFIYIWIVTFFVLLISFAVVFPIVYQTKSKIFNTLALFTKIPLRDVEYYNTHYKQIMLNLGRIDDSSELLKIVQLEAEQNQKDLITLKRTEANSFIRTRNYKGINIDKFSFISKVLILFLTIYGLIIAKDMKLFIFLWDQDNLQGLYMQQHQLMASTYRDLIHYKQGYADALSQQNYTDNIIIFDLDPGNLVNQFLDSYSKLDFYVSTFYQNMIQMNLCQFLDSNVMNCSYFDQSYCDKTIIQIDLITTYAFDPIWGHCDPGDVEEGTVNFMLDVNNFLKNQISVLNSFLTIQNFDNRTQNISNSFQDSYEFDSYENLNHLLIIMRKWYYLSYEALLLEGNSQLILNKDLLIMFIVVIWTMMALGWWREYSKLKSDSKWVTGFIILLPMHLIKENQHLKVFLKKKIKITNLEN